MCSLISHEQSKYFKYLSRQGNWFTQFSIMCMDFILKSMNLVLKQRNDEVEMTLVSKQALHVCVTF